MASGRILDHRPIVTVASRRILKEKIDADRKMLDAKLAEIDADYKKWKIKIGEQRYLEYKDIYARYKQLSPAIEACIADRKAFKESIAALRPLKSKRQQSDHKSTALKEPKSDHKSTGLVIVIPTNPVEENGFSSPLSPNPIVVPFSSHGDQKHGFLSPRSHLKAPHKLPQIAENANALERIQQLQLNARVNHASPSARIQQLKNNFVLSPKSTGSAAGSLQPLSPQKSPASADRSLQPVTDNKSLGSVARFMQPVTDKKSLGLVTRFMQPVNRETSSGTAARSLQPLNREKSTGTADRYLQPLNREKSPSTAARSLQPLNREKSSGSDTKHFQRVERVASFLGGVPRTMQKSQSEKQIQGSHHAHLSNRRYQ